MRLLIRSLLALALIFPLYSCSNEDETQTEPGKIETMTKEAGQEAVRTIKTPIEKAQAVADKEKQRSREMDERNSQ